jgi:phage terminase large subunit
MKTTNVFTKNLAAYNQFKGTQTIISNQGGQGSSKTISILQLLKTIAETSKSKKRITIASYALPHLKGGAMQDFDDILYKDGINPNDVRNRSEHKYFLGNSEITFVGIEGNEAKATGPRRDILYVNEANKRITYKVFELMNARTRLATFIDFNPSAEFWFHTEIVPNFEHHLIKSTFLDNPFLPEREKDNILSKKDKPGFENWWKVYGLGELGQLEGAVFTNWKFGEFDESLPFGYGLDFGVKDPDALVKVAIDRKQKKLYWDELLYINGLSTDSLAINLNSRILKNKLIVADSASKRTIKDLKSKGFNIIGAVKNKIIEDIKAMQEYQIIITENSYNLERELNNYIWLDKKGEVPIDDYNHLIDAGRYKTMHSLKPYTKKGQRILK